MQNVENLTQDASVFKVFRFQFGLLLAFIAYIAWVSGGKLSVYNASFLLVLLLILLGIIWILFSIVIMMGQRSTGGSLKYMIPVFIGSVVLLQMYAGG